MKFWLTFIKAVVTVLFIIQAASCRKNYPEGIDTAIHGKLVGSHKKPLQNIKLYIGEYKASILYASVLIRYIDSTITDKDGNYTFKFSTSGNANEYQISFAESDRHLYYGEHRIQVGGSFKYDFSLTVISVLKLKLKYQNNLTPPLKVYNQYNLYGFWSFPVLAPAYLLNREGDTTIFQPVIADRHNYVAFNYQILPDLNRNTYLRAEQKIPVGGYQDTFHAEINLDCSTITTKTTFE